MMDFMILLKFDVGALLAYYIIYFDCLFFFLSSVNQFQQNGRVINSSSAAPVESLKVPPALVDVLRTNLGITNWFAMQAEVCHSQLGF